MDRWAEEWPEVPELPREQLPEIPAALLASEGGQGDDRPEHQVQSHEQEAQHHEVDPTEGELQEGAQEAERREDGEHAGALPALLGDETALRAGLSTWFDKLTTFDDRAVGLRQVQTFRKAVGEVEGELVTVLAEEIDGAWVETPAGVLQVDHRGGYVSWDANAVWPLLLKVARVRRFDPATGEERDGAEVMLELVKEVITSPKFKVTTLRRWKDITETDEDELKATSPKVKIVKFAD